MKNKEKYIDLIAKAFANVDGSHCDFRAKYVLKQTGCYGVSCAECNIRTAEWLEQEYQEPITLTDDEKVILKNIPRKYEWIARDKNGRLYLYLQKPQKLKTYWKSSSLEFEFSIYDDLFQFIKWEDENPYNIDELLKQNGVER